MFSRTDPQHRPAIIPALISIAPVLPRPRGSPCYKPFSPCFGGKRSPHDYIRHSTTTIPCRLISTIVIDIHPGHYGALVRNFSRSCARPYITISITYAYRRTQERNVVDVPRRARGPDAHLQLLEAVVWERFLLSRGRRLRRTTPHIAKHRLNLRPTAR